MQSFVLLLVADMQGTDAGTLMMKQTILVNAEHLNALGPILGSTKTHQLKAKDSSCCSMHLAPSLG